MKCLDLHILKDGFVRVLRCALLEVRLVEESALTRNISFAAENEHQMAFVLTVNSIV